MHEERRSGIAIAAVAILTAILGSFAGFYAGASGMLPGLRTQITGAQVDIGVLTEVEQILRQTGYNPEGLGDLTTGAARGLVGASGDRYAAYMTGTEWSRYQQALNPSYSGIGVTVRKVETHGGFAVLSVTPGAPADKAGLRVDDIIVAVDGRDLTRMSQEDATGTMRGPEGTSVTLTVRRGDSPAPLQFTLVRATIKRESVQSRMLEGAVGYIRLLTFAENDVSSAFAKAVADLRRQGAKSLVVDLRGNGGGLLDEGIKITSVFLKPKEPVLLTETRGGTRRTRYAVVAETSWDGPLAVLVDGSTASASEIFAGAIRDHGRGALIGTKTYGKGSVQSFYTLDGGGRLKLTAERWLTPKGHTIDGQGLAPDVTVELPAGAQGDPQLDAAVRHLQGTKP